MRVRLLSFLAAAAIVHPALGRGQSLEVGGTIASACRGSEGSLCGAGWLVLSGAYLSWMAQDRVEIGIQVANAGKRSYDYNFARDDYSRSFLTVPNPPAHVEVAFLDRSRTFLLSRFIYHFMPGERVRPLLGAEVGGLIDKQNIVCQPSGCEALLPILVGHRVGHESSRNLDLGFVAGVSVRVTDRLRMRFGLQLHNFAGEELSTTAWFAETGYRFGRK